MEPAAAVPRTKPLIDYIHIFVIYQSLILEFHTLCIIYRVLIYQNELQNKVQVSAMQLFSKAPLTGIQKVLTGSRVNKVFFLSDMKFDVFKLSINK